MLWLARRKRQEEEQRIDPTRTLAVETPDAWRLTFPLFQAVISLRLPSLRGARDVLPDTGRLNNDAAVLFFFPHHTL